MQKQCKPISQRPNKADEPDGKTDAVSRKGRASVEGIWHAAYLRTLGVRIQGLSERAWTMKIRHATKSDLKGIAAIHAESWKNAYSDVLPAEFLAGQIDRDFESHWKETQIQNGDIVLVAEENSLVGFVAVWCRPIPFIDNLHVRPSQRSKKIGSGLMKAVAKELIKKGHSTAYLWVFENNEKAIRFYERLGGLQKEQSMKNVFGYDVLSRKIEWDDISTICENQ